MPKEVIYAGNQPYGEDLPARSVVELRWDREAAHVSLVTRCVHASDHEVFIPEWIQKSLGTHGLAHTGELRSADDGRDVIFTAQDGWFIDLDRRGINQLIRNLRRARDQAFGRDE
jgi:hypothetical protein